MKHSILKKVPVFFLIILLMLLAIKNPQKCADGVKSGLLTCAGVIIPSLYPFTVCVLLLIKSNVLEAFDFIEPFTKKLFKMNFDMFAVFILSQIGGYPVGSRMISELRKNGKISSHNAKLMVNFCVNGGPAFIIFAVGNGILGSKKAGYVLLFSHLLATFLIALVLSRFFKYDNKRSKSEKVISGLADSFVSSASDGAGAIISICSYVCLFSGFNSCIKDVKILKPLTYLTEVTYGITQTKNILFISFLLGFSGICIWFQVLSSFTEDKINLWLFILCRTAHGLISVAFTYISCKIFNINISVFCNNKSFGYTGFYSNAALSVAILCMTAIFLIHISNKNNSGKILNDIV